MSEHYSLLNQLIGFDIKVIYPGPHNLKGLLVEVKEDYLVLKDDKDVIQYVKLDKIKELTKNTKNIKAKDTTEIESLSQLNFLELLKVFENEWLMVSRDGANVIEGFLSNVSNNYITFVVKDEISFIPISQIAMLSSKLKKKPAKKHPAAPNNQNEGKQDTNKNTKQSEEERQPIRFTKSIDQAKSEETNEESSNQQVKISTNIVQITKSKDKDKENSNHLLDKFKPRLLNESTVTNNQESKNRTFPTTKRQTESTQKRNTAVYQSQSKAKTKA
ncbi:DUF6897 domain-containing protein [Oceanobacillus chungangensis]|uniref:Spore coat protein B n=1 Tax=Oceanobacillus chungangensis TaxID=1229152 RepID=A0A3D8PHG5_9BACI|nr:hypothetical protein [Oceanobacillus chungangensis]RDW15510.1 hypothetical protein CWR45_17170 [Oceanobacillus chungangensis]